MIEATTSGDGGCTFSALTYNNLASAVKDARSWTDGDQNAAWFIRTPLMEIEVREGQVIR